MDTDMVNKLENIEKALTQYEDVYGGSGMAVLKEEGLYSDSLKAELDEIAQEGRDLNIGIVGRVKAGKSSLLNGLLFEGEDVLPKAATPMTAALTVLSYGDKFQATVDQFTENDIAKLAEQHRKYVKEEGRKIAEHEQMKMKGAQKKAEREGASVDHAEIKDKARKAAENDMKNHFTRPAYEQYEMIKKMGASSAEDGVTLQAADVASLMGKLHDYVGAEGSHTPFTKSVSIQMPLNSLKGLSVVDTPGVNDPVVSREERTKEYLRQSDVVFVISPAGQFLTFEDTNLIDRIGNKEGIQELFLVASQVDVSLHGSSYKKSQGSLPVALEDIRRELASHAIDTFRSIKDDHPEVGSLYDPFINEGENRFLVTSGICSSMVSRFGERDNWDKEMNHVWDQLNTNYPDYFSPEETAVGNLKKLANLEGIHENLEYAREEKDRIQEERRKSSLAKAKEKIQRTQTEILKGIQAQVSLVKHANAKDLEVRKNNLEKMVAAGSEAVDGEFDEILDEFSLTLKGEIKAKTQSIFGSTRDEVRSSEQEKSETRRRDKGAGFLWHRSMFGTRYENYTHSYTSVKSNAVLNNLRHMTSQLESEAEHIVESSLVEWKKKLQRGITRSLRESVGDERIDLPQLKKALRSMVNEVEIPEFSYFREGNIETEDDLWGETGELRDQDAEIFVAKAENYVIKIKNKFNQDIKKFLEELRTNLSSETPSSLLFTNMKEEIDTLEKQMKEKKITLDRLNSLDKQIRECA